jgi:hypothetical protein
MTNPKQTIWRLVQRCARELTKNGMTPFTRGDLVRCVQRANPSYGANAISPIIQGVTDNLQGGAPGAVGKNILHRVGRGLFVLKDGSVDAAQVAAAPTGRPVRTRDHRITVDQARAARAAFESSEPRDLFYRAATELVELALKKATSLTLAEALSVLLQTWNREYYRYRRFDGGHFAEIENLLTNHRDIVARYREAPIDQLSDKDGPTVVSLFEAFEAVLGPVGAAKALHLLAPRFFPLWDRRIAKEYRFALGRVGSNGNRYWQFMLIARTQCLDLAGKLPGNPLKAVDEYNYGKYSKHFQLL